ncbi:superoxide dismutase family protein [Maribacter sp. 2-571]|uniref:superoxide dismutase family protein n=1 Tax=Maribacter sp. 2-571 TaxID=3417569 RepID=UPI003D3283F9
MKRLQILTLVLLAGFSYQCKDAKKGMEDAKEETEAAVDEMKKETEEAMAPKTITFAMSPKSDSSVEGEVTFTEEDGSVKMVAMLSGLSEGEHAIHIHEKADCSSADGKSTGGHWNPTKEPHGKWGAAEGYHKGDIGNFAADAEGKATKTFVTDQWCIGCDDATKNIVGKAVIVHQGVDDYESQPSGAAGKRVSCTGIIQ